MKITIGTGSSAVVVDALDMLINDKQNKLTITEITPNPNDYQKGSNDYDPKTNTVQWRNEDGIFFKKDATKYDSPTNTGYNSPMALLAHELLHGYDDFYDADYMTRRNDISTRNEGLVTVTGKPVNFTNAEEKYVTTTLANQVNGNLNEDLRTHYGRSYYPTQGPTTTKK